MTESNWRQATQRAQPCCPKCGESVLISVEPAPALDESRCTCRACGHVWYIARERQ